MIGAQNTIGAAGAEVIIRGEFAAHKIADDLSYGLGAIEPANVVDEAFVGTVLDCIEPVAEDQLEFSSCTDGRLPLKLLDGEDVPVREQLVGADMVSAFYVAETLGDRFYANSNAPVAERVIEVAVFLQENGIFPSTHVLCGAGGGFVPITENVVKFGGNQQYAERGQILLPSDVYDEGLHAEMLKGNSARLAKNAYAGLTADVFVDAVMKVSGGNAVAELCDDGRGVHGHVEDLILRNKIPGYALNVKKLAERTGGREVFGANDARMERLARLFARGNDRDYRTAMMALEDFADSGHATLARNMSTYVVALA